MTRCFPKSNLVNIGLIVAGIACSAAILLLQDELSFITLILAIVPTFLGVVLGRVFAVRQAMQAHAKVLSILLRAGDPDRFIDTYAPIIDRTKPDSAEQIMMTGYLSLAYAAKGDVDRALDLLRPLSPEVLTHHQLGSVALVHNYRCMYYLQRGAIAEAEESMALLEAIAEEAESRQPTLSVNLKNNLALFRQHLKVLKGADDVDFYYLRSEVDHSANAVYETKNKLLLAKAYLAAGERSKGVDVLEELYLDNQKLCFVREGRDLLDKLAAEAAE